MAVRYQSACRYRDLQVRFRGDCVAKLSLRPWLNRDSVRPSIDPVLMLRMLMVGHVFAGWFCKLGIEDSVPDHSVFCRARHERFRKSDALRRA
jgi:hypothetical protein